MPTIPFFGRAWQVTINTQDEKQYVFSSVVPAPAIPTPGQSSVQPFKIVFSVDTYLQLVFWHADITIYNPSRSDNAVKADNIPVKAGDSVTLSAGYENGEGYGDFTPENCLLFSGMVFQPIWTRVNVVDTVLKLRCIFGWMESMKLMNFDVEADATVYTTLKSIATNSGGLTVDADAKAISILDSVKIPGTQVIDGKLYEVVQKLMQQSTLFAWVAPTSPSAPPAIHVRSFGQDERSRPTMPDVIYGPPNLLNPPAGARLTLLEIPQQTNMSSTGDTQFGVTFRVLLDPTIRNGQVVQLAQGTVVAPYEFAAQQELSSKPSPEGMYIVTGVRHVGDSRGRGEDWYTEITGATWDWFASFAAASLPTQ